MGNLKRTMSLGRLARKKGRPKHLGTPDNGTPDHHRINIGDSRDRFAYAGDQHDFIGVAAERGVASRVGGGANSCQATPLKSQVYVDRLGQDLHTSSGAAK